MVIPRRRCVLATLLSFMVFGMLSVRTQTGGSPRAQEKGKTMANPVVHFEVLGKDGERLQQFYRDLFGWKIDVE